VAHSPNFSKAFDERCTYEVSAPVSQGKLIKGEIDVVPSAPIPNLCPEGFLSRLP
jgi:hypothetical protein